ncbi:hypothetical protein CPC08DRAFT_820799 [Agrocybe pediades]|nr:hypothetical protein CPC08DRAFT_820799 [Agrocybe pediades]
MSSSLPLNRVLVPLPRLNLLLAEAVDSAKAVDPQSADDASIRKARALAKSLLDALPVDPAVAAIAYDERKASFLKAVEELEKSCKPRDWRCDWEIHGCMMVDIIKNVGKWFSPIWIYMQKEDSDLAFVEKCLILCGETINRTAGCKARASFWEIENTFSIFDDGGEVVYEELLDITHPLGWMWRELLVIATSRGVPIDSMVANIQQFRLDSEVYDFIRQPGEQENRDGYKFWDTHWSAEMRAAASEVAIHRYHECLRLFKEKPSYKAYQKLVSKYPELQLRLVTCVCDAIFSESYMPLGQAAKILMENSKTDELIRLLDRDSRSLGQDVQRDIVIYLSMQPSDAHRARGLKALKDGLDNVQRTVWSEIENTFPNWDAAYCWLEEMVDSHRRGKGCESDSDAIPRPPTKSKAERARDNEKLQRLLATYADIAARSCHGGPGPLTASSGYDSDEESDSTSYNNDDWNDYLHEARRQSKADRELTKNINAWIVILLNWPNAEEKAALWDKVRNREPMVIIDGAEEELASRYRHRTSFQYLADGIRAMKRAFSCKDLAEFEELRV